MNYRMIIIAVAVIILAACGSEEPTDSGDAPGFVQLHQEVFAPGCSASACHAGDSGIAGLSFEDPQQAYDQLIEVAPTNGPARSDGLLRVTPGDLDASFLWTKLTTEPHHLAHLGYGALMPMGTSTVPGPNSLEAIREWIEAGAPYDGQDFEGDFVDASNFDNYVDCDAEDEEGLRECFGEEPDPDQFVRLYSPPLIIPPQSDTTLCSYIDYYAPEDIVLSATRSLQMHGGHHVAVFVANSPSNDFEPDECSDEDMINYRYVAGAGGGGGLDTEMPEGVALRIDQGLQVVLQSHYINTSDEPMVVMDAVDLELSTHQAPIIADPFALLYSAFEIPPHSEHYERVSECTIDEAMDIYMLLGHTHEYGVLFEVEHIAEGGEADLLYHATDGRMLRNTPEIKMYDPPLRLEAGDQLRMTCAWENPYDTTITWPQEMCVGLMYYGPGRGWLNCSENDEYPVLLGEDAEGCADPWDQGNELGVGRYCTYDECQGLDARFCLAPVDPSSNFCSIVGCDTDDECGEGAVCHHDSAGSACVPEKCLD